MPATVPGGATGPWQRLQTVRLASSAASASRAYRLASVSGFPPIAKVFLRGTKLTRFPPPEEGAPCHRTTRALGGNFTKPQLLRPTLNRWNRAFRPRGERLISDSTIDKWIMEARPKKDMLSTMRSLA